MFSAALSLEEIQLAMIALNYLLFSVDERRILLFKTPRFDVAEMMNEDSEEEEGGTLRFGKKGVQGKVKVLE